MIKEVKTMFRAHGKWLFIPSPTLVFVGAMLGVEWMVYTGIGLLGALLFILVIQLVTKRELIQ